MQKSKKSLPEKLVSVCIASFNSGKLINKTIQSIQESTYDQLEIVINDDCSTDLTQQAVKRSNDGRVRFFRNPVHLGVPANWNQAIRKAKGDYICFLNHDDEISPFWISYAARILNTYPSVGWITSAFRVINAEGKTLYRTCHFPENRPYAPREVFPVVARLDGLGPGFFVRKDVFDEIGGFDDTMGPSADNELFLRLSLKQPMFYSTTFHVAWKMHADNLTHRWNLLDQTNDAVKILKKTFSRPDLPIGLKKMEKSIYIRYYKKVLQSVVPLLNSRDLETVQGIFSALSGLDAPPFHPAPGARAKQSSAKKSEPDH